MHLSCASGLKKFTPSTEVVKFSFVILNEKIVKSQGLLLSVNMLFTGHVKELLWLDCCPMELVQDGEEWMVFSDSMKMGRLDGLDGLDGLDVKCTSIQWCIKPNHTLLYDLNPGLI